MKQTTRHLMLAVAAIATIVMSPNLAECFPWSIDMYRGPEVQPFAVAPRVTVADTIPVHGAEPPMTVEQATSRMHNPLQPSPDNLAKGKAQFNIYCTVCHGESGEGNGTVVKVLSRPPKNLVTGASKFLPDGYMYGVIRDGILSMPSYAEEMPVEQRWQTVLYVRSLQKTGQKMGLSGGKAATDK